jgi:hypothetical protein
MKPYYLIQGLDLSTGLPFIPNTCLFETRGEAEAYVLINTSATVSYAFRCVHTGHMKPYAQYRKTRRQNS